MVVDRIVDGHEILVTKCICIGNSNDTKQVSSQEKPSLKEIKQIHLLSACEVRLIGVMLRFNHKLWLTTMLYNLYALSYYSVCLFIWLFYNFKW